jgi:hypothetical protein
MNLFKGGQNSAADCLKCNFQSNYDIFSYIFPVHFYCQHSKFQFSPKCRVKIARNALIVGWIIHLAVLICLMVSFLSEFYLCDDKSSCFVLISDYVFIIGDIIVTVIILARAKSVHREFNSWLHIFENRKIYNLGQIIHGSDVNKFKIYRMVSLFNFIVSLLMTLFYFITELHVSFARKCVLSFCTTFQVVGVCEFFKRVSLVGAIMKTFEESLKTALILPFPQHRSLMHSFPKYHHLLRTINANLALFMKTMASLLFIWSITSTVSMIFNIYVLIKYTDYDLQSMIFIHLRVVFIIMGIFTILIVAEDCLNRKVSFTCFILIFYDQP